MTLTVTLVPLALVVAVLALALATAVRQRRARIVAAGDGGGHDGLRGVGFGRAGETVVVLGADGHAYDARLTGLRAGEVGSLPLVSELVALAPPVAAAPDWDSIDEIMGIPTRHRFLELVRRELSRARRYGRPLGLLALRVDRCDDVVGTHGHEVADAVLRAVAATVMADLAAKDSLGRLGADVFGVCLPETDAARAAAVAARLVEEVGQIAVPTGGADVGVTASVAACSFAAGDAYDLDRLLAAADAALAHARAAGGNRVEALKVAAAGPGPPRSPDAAADAAAAIPVAERGAA